MDPEKFSFLKKTNSVISEMVINNPGHEIEVVVRVNKKTTKVVELTKDGKTEVKDPPPQWED